MKFRALILFAVVFIFGIMMSCQKINRNNPEKILTNLKEIRKYQCEVIYKIKNARGEITVDTKHYYDSNLGTRVEFGQDRVQIYKDKKIYVRENKTNRNYEMEKDFDELYSYAFIDKISKLFINDEEFKYYDEKKEGVNNLVVEFNTTSSNKNIVKEVLYVDKATYKPIKAILYDERGDERGEITYSNFNELKDIDEKLFDIN